MHRQVFHVVSNAARRDYFVGIMQTAAQRNASSRPKTAATTARADYFIGAAPAAFARHSLACGGAIAAHAAAASITAPTKRLFAWLVGDADVRMVS